MAKGFYTIELVLWIFLLGCLISTTTTAETDLLKQRIEKLEQEVRELSNQNLSVRSGFNQGLSFLSSDGNNKFRLRMLLQMRYEYLGEEHGDSTQDFSIPRAQIRLRGHLANPKLRYKVMMLGRTTSAGGNTTELRDAYIDYHWRKELKIQLGQMIVPFDYEDQQPTWSLSGVDRSIMNSKLGFERDIGLRLHGNVWQQRFNYSCYAMNGNGRNKLNGDSDLMYGVRTNFHLLGKQHVMLSDLPLSTSPQLAVGMGVLHRNSVDSVADNEMKHYTAEVTYRFRGISILAMLNQAKNITTKSEDDGYMITMGYFIKPNKLEIMAQHVAIEQEGAMGLGTVEPEQATIGVNYYFSGHNSKWQVAITQFQDHDSTSGKTANQLRMQYQLFL